MYGKLDHGSEQADRAYRENACVRGGTALQRREHSVCNTFKLACLVRPPSTPRP